MENWKKGGGRVGLVTNRTTKLLFLIFFVLLVIIAVGFGCLQLVLCLRGGGRRKYGMFVIRRCFGDADRGVFCLACVLSRDAENFAN